MNIRMFDWIYNLSRWCIGIIFIYAGTVKLLEPKIFAVLIDAYGIVPENLLIPVAVTLPAVEIVAGLGLLFDIEKSLFIISGLLVLFIAILGYGIRMGLDVDCGCFGPEEPEAKAFHGLKDDSLSGFGYACNNLFYLWMAPVPRHPAGTNNVVNQKFMGKKENERCVCLIQC